MSSAWSSLLLERKTVATETAVDVVVVGSINQDVSVTVPAIPSAGETVLGGALAITAGGKGANQAVAAARLGARVTMVGRVGDDAAGHAMLDNLTSNGVDVSKVEYELDSPTGTALISIDQNGENSIVVAPGANATLTPESLPGLSGKVMLLQLEIPLETVVAAARDFSGTVILNPAPARGLPEELLEYVDVLVPNEGELAAITGILDPVEAARSLVGPRWVAVTRGERGALLVDRDNAISIEAPAVEAVDTTGAGDAFCGALAAELARGSDVEAACATAVRAGAHSVTRLGAQAGLPLRADLEG